MRCPFVVAVLAAGAAALSCREPTQVTLELSTNAACATEPLAPLMLLETGIVAGMRSVSAEVSCTESGTCTDPGAAGGGVGGSGGDGTGGAGGEGGVTVTEVDGQGSFRHVAGVDETGTVYALHVDRLGSVLYEVLGTQVEGLFTESPPPTTSVAMHAALFDGIEVVAWDHDPTVRVWDGSPSEWAGASQPADFVLEGPDGRFALLRTNEYLVDVFIGGLPTQTCGVPMVGAPLAFARSGGEYFMVGEELCTCAGACLTLNGQLPWVDVSARRDVPVAVGVTQFGFWTWNAQSTLDQVDLIASTDEGQLGNVHVTPSGDVWVAATIEGL
ncbi:MAG: hypothetical protein JNL21_35700 [Myxococcales bacterium]|nr:hypothetical protein [Myxococcales bacterium]